MYVCTPHFYSPIAVPHLLPPLYPSRSILQLYSPPSNLHPTIPCSNVPLLQLLSLFLATSPQLNITIHNLPLLTFYATLFCRYSPPSNLHLAVKYPCLSHFCTLLHLPLLAQVFRRALPPATTLPLITRHFASPAIPYRPPLRYR